MLRVLLVELIGGINRIRRCEVSAAYHVERTPSLVACIPR
jgi:hypothetical protein